MFKGTEKMRNSLIEYTVNVRKNNKEWIINDYRIQNINNYRTISLHTLFCKLCATTEIGNNTTINNSHVER